MAERERIPGKTDDGHRIVMDATPWQQLVLRANSSRVGPWRGLVYSLFSVAFGLCDVAEAIRAHAAPGAAASSKKQPSDQGIRNRPSEERKEPS